jgi:hypothetical protein
MVRVYRCPALALLFLALAASPNASGQEPAATNSPTLPAEREAATDADGQQTLAVWAGHVESDNIARSPTAGRGSFENIGLLTGLEYTSARITTSLDTDLEFRKYSGDVLGNETVGTLGALASFKLVRDVFRWDFGDHYDQGRRDQFAPIGPNNRESINVVTSGPHLDLPIGARTKLSLGGTYNARRYDESSNVDSDSVVYELGFFRQASETAVIGINATSNEVDYTVGNAPTYDIDRLSLRYDKMLASGAVHAALGKNKITFSNGSSDQPLFDFGWSRALTARTTLALTAAREFTDAGGLVAPTSVANPTGAGETLVSTSPLEQKRLGVSLTLKMTRTDLTFALGNADESYVGATTLDDDVTTTQVAVRRMLSPRLDLGGSFDRARREYSGGGLSRADDQDTTISAWLARSLGRRFNAVLAWSQYQRHGNLAFNETRYEVRIGYSPTGSGAAAMASAGR